MEVDSQRRSSESVGELQLGFLSPIGGVDLVSAVDLVSDSLRHAIVQGKLQPGTRLRHEAIAASLQVSRQPVREALRQLQAEGFVLRSGDRGYVVRSFSESEVEEAYYLRWLLESDATSLAAERASVEQIERMTLTNLGIRNALSLGRSDEMSRLNGEFHKLIRVASGTSLLVEVINKVWVGITVLTPIFVPERASKSAGEHDVILDAIRERRPEAARNAMREHIAAGARDYYHARNDGPSEFLRRTICGDHLS